METMQQRAATNGLVVVDEEYFLDFTLEDDEEERPNPKTAKTTAFIFNSALTRNGSLPDCVEEELEWLSNKEAFPSVESCFGILSDNLELVKNHQSPVSVLENSSSSSSNNNSNTNNNGSTVASCFENLKVPTNYPVRARSQRRSRKRRATGSAELPGQQCLWMNVLNTKEKQESSFSFPPMPANGAGMGRRCLHCQADTTPQWRAGPMGPKTLCNACGVRYKSGRLLPEYRPANSPTFSNTLHSNSHRKVVEMRRQKQVATGGGVMANEGCGYRVGG